MMILLAIVLALAFLNSALFDRTYRALPLRELRRRARSGSDKRAGALYKVMAHGPTLELLLWLKGTLAATILIIWAARTSLWLALAAGLVISFIAVAGRSKQTVPAWQIRFVVFVAPLVAWVLELLQPVVGRIAGPLKNRRSSHPPTRLYEKEDLLELLKSQKHQSDNRFSDSELTIAGNALTFGDRLVSQAMTPRAKLKLVAGGEAIGPMLMDDLHKSGQSRFLVVKEVTKSANLQIMGTLYIKDLLEHLDQKGSVRDIMHAGPGYINEAQTLSQALDAFLKTHQHLLVVVNNFEEVSGALSIEQVIEHILGQKISGEFDHYQDLSAVAGIHK